MDELIVNQSGYIQLKKFDDGDDGHLSIIEAMKDIPFEIKRVYYINNLKNVTSVRGHHAHKKLYQAIFCINGSFLLGLDDGKNRQKILVDNDNVGFIIGPGLWHTMSQFSNETVILVAASDYYDETDYIRDYDDFLLWIENNQI